MADYPIGTKVVVRNDTESTFQRAVATVARLGKYSQVYGRSYWLAFPPEHPFARGDEMQFWESELQFADQDTGGYTMPKAS